MNDHSYRPEHERHEALPILAYKHEIIEALQSCSTLVIVGETGSGKSTKIPQFIHEAFVTCKESQIAITQPRRIAAMTLARRVASELKSPLGHTVGYSVRFDECSSAEHGRIKYLTDGMLLREYLSDPFLCKYSWICLDEVHERSLRTDVLFGLLKKLQKEREGSSLHAPLKLIVMSATLDVATFVDFFSDAGGDGGRASPTLKVIQVQGRQFPVRVFYTLEPQTDYLDACVLTIFQIHMEGPKGGDMLVFLSGQDEIEAVSRVLADNMAYLPKGCDTLAVVPLYAALSPAKQLLAFRASPEGTRKVVLATNIAETSITIPGIRYVIDSGVAKLRLYHGKQGFESLAVTPISKAAAKQRSGRAGRDRDGYCYRLYTEDAFQSLMPSTIPEIKRSNLSFIVLFMKASGIGNILDFDYLDPPPRHLLSRALEELFALQALDSKGELTQLGRQMAMFPLEPSLSRVLLSSKERQCTDEVITVISLLSVENLFYAKRGQDTSFHPAEEESAVSLSFAEFSDPMGDHLTLLRLYKSYRENVKDKHWLASRPINKRSFQHALKIREQLIRYCHRAAIPILSCGSNTDAVLQCFVEGYSSHIAHSQPDHTFKCLSHSSSVRIHPGSVLFNKKGVELVLYHELVLTTKCYMRGVSRVDPLWLQQFSAKKKKQLQMHD